MGLDVKTRSRRKDLRMLAMKRRAMCLRVRALTEEEESQLEDLRAAHCLRRAAVQRFSEQIAFDHGIVSGTRQKVQASRSGEMSLGSSASKPSSLCPARSPRAEQSQGKVSRRDFMRTFGRRMHARARPEFAVSARPPPRRSG